MACRNWCTNPPVDPSNTKNDPESQLILWEVDVAKFSTWFVNEVLNVFDRSDAPEIPAQFYVAMHSSTCSAGEAGTELSGSGYERQAVTFEKVTDIRRWSSAEVEFPFATGQYTVASLSIWDDATAGNYYAYGNLASAVTVNVNNAINIPANKIILQLS